MPEVTENQHQNVKIPNVSCRTIPGVANPANKGAIDWGPHNLLAYGSHSTVVIVDTVDANIVQTLDQHKSSVSKVKWSMCPSPTSVSVSLAPVLASADSTGHIIIWDVASGDSSFVLQDGTKPILDMQWITTSDDFLHLLAAIHPPYALVMWDTNSGTKLWKKSFTENLLSFAMDPFDGTKMAFLCQECILFVEDLHPMHQKAPSSNGNKFYVSTPPRSSPSAMSSRGSMGNLATVGSGSTTAADERLRTRDQIRRLMREMVVGETRPKQEDSMTVRECLEMSYHRSLRNHLLLLYQREVLILDLDIHQTVGIVPVEKMAAPLLQVISCHQRDVLYCLHESGSISVKLRRRLGAYSVPTPASEFAESFKELGYEQKCQSDILRLTKSTRVLGMVQNPSCEREISLFLSSGRIVFLELLPTALAAVSNHTGLSNQGPGNIGDNTTPTCRGLLPWPRDTLSELLPAWGSDQALSVTPLPLQLIVRAILPCIGLPPLVVRMCPPLTTQNWRKYVPLLAVGTSFGSIHIIRVDTGIIEKELGIHSCPVRGIEWAGLNSFLSYAHPNVGSGASHLKLRNELSITDVLTGGSTQLRIDKGDESPIEMIRISHLKQYFIVAFKDDPFELWDLHSLTLLRTMPKKFPVVTALEWSPSYASKSQRKKTAESAKSHGDQPQGASKEHFVFTDMDTQLYHFTVEGSVIRDGFKILPEGSLGTVTWVSYKSDLIIRCDTDGVLNIWDVRLRSSRMLNTNRGWIKKTRFAPGKGNLKLLVLFGDGVDIWDLREFQRSAQLKCSKDTAKVSDIDWVSSDKAVLALQDGSLRIVDVSLNSPPSHMLSVINGNTFCPSLLSPKEALHLRTLLCLGKNVDDSRHTLTNVETDNVNGQMSLVDPALLQMLPSLSCAQRSLLAARLFGDDQEVAFWTVTMCYLRAAKEKTGEFGGGRRSAATSLDLHFDLLCEAHIYKRHQIERISLHESKRLSYEQTQRVAQQLILLGDTDKAVQLLLETDDDSPNYFADGLRACLVATVKSSGAAQSTIKLVATNLISNKKIWEGVQLLCLIQKGLDACRYLQLYSQWEDAAWLAKASLPSEQVAEVFTQWANHLIVAGHKTKAVLLLVSLGQFEKALEVLVTLQCRMKTALFLQACLESGVIEQSDSIEPLSRVIQLNYAWFLFEAGLLGEALVVCDQLGETGSQLRKEFEILSPEMGGKSEI